MTHLEQSLTIADSIKAATQQKKKEYDEVNRQAREVAQFLKEKGYTQGVVIETLKQQFKGRGMFDSQKVNLHNQIYKWFIEPFFSEAESDS